MILKKYSFKTLTPLFINGPIKNKVELRTASLKGALRYWYRAAIAEANIENLYKKENEIFGSTDSASTFIIKIKNLSKINAKSNIAKKVLVYFNKHKAPALKQDIEFEVEIIIRSDQFQNEITSSLTIFTMLGGLGKRVRRGFGSIINKDDKFESPIDFLARLKNELFNLNNSDMIIENNSLMINHKGKANYPFVKEVIIGKTAKRADLLKKIDKCASENNNYALGNGDPRMASPVFVTIKEINDNFYPVITKLNEVYPEKNYKVEDYEKKIAKFIDCLVS